MKPFDNLLIGNPDGGGSGLGDVVGPASATDGAAALFDGTTGELLKDSKVIVTIPASAATLTLGSGKTVAVSNSLTLAGTDSTTMTFPTTSATVARTDAANTFTGTQTFSGDVSAATVSGAAVATAAQIITRTATNLIVTPARAPYSQFGWNWYTYPGAEFSSASAGGSGAGSAAYNTTNFKTGATGSSWYRRSTAAVTGLFYGASTGISFDKPVGFVVTFDVRAATTNGRSRFSWCQGTFGADAGGTTGQLASKGIGVEVQNLALYGAVHDGAALTTTSLGVSATLNAPLTVLCVRSAAGSFDYYVNGTFAATVTGGPTGTTSTAYGSIIMYAADNQSDAANQEVDARFLKLFQGF